MWFVVAGLIAAVATIPRLSINYGMDGDCIRGVMAAQMLIADGVYMPSRLPGNPAFEVLLSGLTFIDGPLLTNGVILLFFVFAVIGFAFVARETQHRTLLICLFCLTPILLVNAATTMDYIPGLAALIWGYVALRADRPVLAALLFGFAVGCRLSNVLFVVPFGLYLYFNRAGAWSVLYPMLGAAVGLLFYVPIFMQSGPHMFWVPPQAYGSFSYILFMGYNLLMVFGPLATVGLAVVLALRLPYVAHLTREAIRQHDASYTAALAAVVVFVVLFLVHPDEPAYLIPAVPFCYLLLDRWLDIRSLGVIAVLIISFGLLSIEFKGGESGRRHFTARLQTGIVAKDYLDRKELEAIRSGITNTDFPDRTIVLHGYGPMLGFENPGLMRVNARTISPNLDEAGVAEPLAIHQVNERAIYLVSGLSAANVRTLQQEGYRIYYFSESAPSHSIHSWGYDPREIGLTRLDVLGDNAFYRRH